MPVSIIEKAQDSIEIEAENRRYKFSLYKCPTTNWDYFYAAFPITVLNSDDDEDHEIGLQPRYLIYEKVFNLFRHFQKHPVLQPSICRLHNGHILVFDGQHKIASLLWGGRKFFECKIYLNPNPSLLNQTNISAHDKFAQTRFFSSILVAKLGSQFGKEFENYKNLEDGSVKSERGLILYLKEREQLSNADINERFRSFLYNSILDSNENKVSRFVSKGNRGSSDKPITVDMLEKSLFSAFLYREPVEDDMTKSNYMREQEIDNMIRFFNILYDETLCEWDGSRPESDLKQNRLNRMFRSKSIMAWSEILHDAVCAKLNLIDSEDRVMPLYRQMQDSDFSQIKFIIKRLATWSLWSTPENSEIERVLADNKSAVKKYFKDKGLTTGYLMGAPE